MNCNDYFMLLCGHLDGINTEAEEQSLQAHLTQCEACRALLDELRANDAALCASVQTLPADLTANIMRQVKKEAKKKNKKYWNLAFTAVASAAVLAIVLLGSFGAPMEKSAPMNLVGANARSVEPIAEYAPVAAEPETAIVTEAAAGAAEDATDLITGDVFDYESDGSFVYGCTAASEPKASVLFVYASEIPELAEEQPVEISLSQLSDEAVSFYQSLDDSSAKIYCVSYSVLQALKDQYPNQCFEADTDICFVIVAPSK